MAKDTALNRRNVLEYFELVFNRHNPRLAAEKYLNSHYVHHGFECESGSDEFVRYFSDYFTRFPNFRSNVLHCVAEGEIVVLRVESYFDSGSPTQNAAEFYRVENEKISEHWHVVQN